MAENSSSSLKEKVAEGSSHGRSTVRILHGRTSAEDCIGPDPVSGGLRGLQWPRPRSQEDSEDCSGLDPGLASV